MDADGKTDDGAKARRRKAAKAPGRPRQEKVRKNLCLSADAAERLRVHASRAGLNESAMVENLINAHLRRYVVHDLGGADRDASAA